MRLTGLFNGGGERRRTGTDRRSRTAFEARSIVLGEREIVYSLRRSVRRSSALQVDPRGVRVSVPVAMAQEEVDAFIVKHGSWLLARLDALEGLADVARFEAVDGALFPVFGRQCRLRIDSAARRGGRWRVAADDVEELLLPGGGDVRSRLVAALKARARTWFMGRVEEYCACIGRSVPAVRLTSARTRWGSCSVRSGIRLHWRLIHLPPEVSDYVVAHEVAHLLEMNHSTRFWSVVDRLYPRWREARAELRACAGALPAIDERDRTPGGAEGQTLLPTE